MLFFVLKILLVSGVFVGGGIWLSSINMVFSVICWIIGIIIGVFGALLALLLFGGTLATREGFKNGLLTGGIIDDRSKHSVIHIAVISNGGDPSKYIFGIQRQKYDAFPYQSLDKGVDRIACASVFSDEVHHPGSWHSFSPTPVAFGTSDPVRIRGCLWKVEQDDESGTNCFAVLERFLARHSVPEDFKELYVCDLQGNLLETRIISKKGESTPPPLPPQNAQVTQTAVAESGLIELLQRAAGAHGLNLAAAEGGLIETSTGFTLVPQLLSSLQVDSALTQTATILNIAHPDLFPDGIYEYQHSIGTSEADSLQKGFDQWAQLDWPVLREALSPEHQSCTRMDMEYPAAEGRVAHTRSLILGPVMHMGIDQGAQATSEEQHPSGCPCCLLTNSMLAFREQLETPGVLFALRLFAMRDDDGSTQADCRINGEEYEPGKAALAAYAASWPQAGFESRKQYVVATSAPK